MFSAANLVAISQQLGIAAIASSLKPPGLLLLAGIILGWLAFRHVIWSRLT